MLNRSPSLKDKHEAEETERLAALAKVEEAHKEALEGEVEITKTKKKHK